MADSFNTTFDKPWVGALGRWRSAAALALGLAVSLPAARAQMVDTQWLVDGFRGSAAFIQPEALMGQAQVIQGGFAEGPFYACDLAGQSMRYTRYGVDAFFQNPEFEVFKLWRAELSANTQHVFVHRIQCAGGDAAQRRTLYPFVTNDADQHAWLAFEDGVFRFKAKAP